MPEIQMPKLSDTMTEGTLVSWKKKKGDKVSAGEVIAEIETDKATMEWESPEDGTLTEIFVEEGGKVNVGDKIAFIGEEGEEAPKEKPKKEEGAEEEEKEKKPQAETEKPAPAEKKKKRLRRRRRASKNARNAKAKKNRKRQPAASAERSSTSQSFAGRASSCGGTRRRSFECKRHRSRRSRHRNRRARSGKIKDDGCFAETIGRGRTAGDKNYRRYAHQSFRHAQRHRRASGREQRRRCRIFISTSISMPVR